MKLLLLALACCGLACAQQGGNGCDANSKPKEANIQVTTNTATTLVAGSTGIIHLCTVALSTATTSTIGLQGTDGTGLWTNVQTVATAFLPFNGILTTRRAAVGSGIQIIFSTAPASSVGVFVTYYITAD